MTTIAFDGETIAADSLITSHGNNVGEAGKIAINSNNTEIYAFAGDIATFPAWIKWWQGSQDPKDIPVIPADSRCVLIIVNEEGIFEVDSSAPYKTECGIKIHDGRTVYAAGSGQDLALGALFVGAKAASAVDAAKHFDTGTGGSINVVTLPWIEEAK